MRQPIHTVRRGSAEHGAFTIFKSISAKKRKKERKIPTVDRAHHVSGLVPDAFPVAIILVRLRRRDVEHAVPERAERDARVAYVAGVGEGHFEDGDVADHRGRDGGDEEEEGGGEEEDGADPVEGGCAGHGSLGSVW